MRNSILKNALNKLGANGVTKKNFEVISSLESIRGGAALGCTNCKKKQSGGSYY